MKHFAALAVMILMGCAPVRGAPASSVSIEARIEADAAISNEDMQWIGRQYAGLIDTLDVADSARLYDSQQLGMPLVHAIFTLAPRDMQADALRRTAALVRRLPTYGRVAGEGRTISLDGVPLEISARVARHRLFPARSGDQIQSAPAQQFSYLLSTVVRMAAQSAPPDGKEEGWRRDLEAIYAFLVDDILSFYWTEAPAWHWAGALPNGRARALARLRGDAKIAGPPHYRAFTDYELHLFATAADLKDAVRRDPALIRTEADSRLLGDIVAVGFQALSDRIDFGPDGKGFAFDRGLWALHPVAAHANCVSRAVPRHECRRENIVQDMSHARRWPWWLQSFAAASEGSENASRVRRWRQALADQVGNRVIRFDARSRPLMTNFIDGHDGWYLYDAAGHSGNPPTSLTGWSMRYGSWALIAGLNPRLEAATAAFCNVVMSKSPEDVAFRTRYFGSPSADEATAFAPLSDEYGPRTFYAIPCLVYRALGLVPS